MIIKIKKKSWRGEGAAFILKGRVSYEIISFLSVSSRFLLTKDERSFHCLPLKFYNKALRWRATFSVVRARDASRSFKAEKTTNV